MLTKLSNEQLAERTRIADKMRDKAADLQKAIDRRNEARDELWRDI